MRLGVLRTLANGQIGFWCPGCQAPHAIRAKPSWSAGWDFNGNYERPTFFPSVMARGYSEKTRSDFSCHSYVTDGEIQFLPDCSHALAGQTVRLQPWGKPNVPEMPDEPESMADDPFDR